MEHTVDPLLFLNTEKSDLEKFLLNTSADLVHLEDIQANAADVKMENSLDIDSLERNGHLGDMNWLHNSSLSTLTHLESHNEDTSDGSNMISVDPQSVLPMQLAAEDNETKPRNFHSPDFANSAAMRLHANCSSLGDSPENPVSQLQEHQAQGIQSPKPFNIIRQDHETIRILSVASQGSPTNSPRKAQNFIITSTRDSPHKPQAFVLSSATGGALPAGLTLSSTNNRNISAGSHFVISSPQKLHAISTDKSGRVLLKSGNNLLSPSQASPVLLGRLQTGIQPQLYQHLVSNAVITPSATVTQSLAAQQHLIQQHHHHHHHPTAAAADSTTVSSTTGCEEKVYPKPSFSYSCLIALALKNSKNGSLPVSEIYNFMCENFPYFKTAPDGWKNSVRHNLSLNKCFAKVDNPKLSQGAKKGCLWALNPAKVTKMEDEISKWGKKDPAGLLTSMAYPENLEAIEKGQAGLNYGKRIAAELSSGIQGEATPTKNPSYSTLSPATSTAVKQELFSPQHQQTFRIEKIHPNIRIEKVEPRTPTKGEMSRVVSSMEVSSPVQRHEVSSPTGRSQTHAQASRIDPSLDLSHLEFPVSLNSDALADIVLQSSMWDEDLENSIDIDLICDSPTSAMDAAHSTTHSPLPVRTSINPSSSIPLGGVIASTGTLSPSMQPLYSQMYSPVQSVNPTPANVRTNLFGISSPLKPLYV